MAEPITEWLRELENELSSERRLRRSRIVVEARDHLSSSADELEEEGRSRQDAELQAVANLGDPRSFARGFSPPTTRDWLVDTTAWWSSRVAAALLGLGRLAVADRDPRLDARRRPGLRRGRAGLADLP